MIVGIAAPRRRSAVTVIGVTATAAILADVRLVQSSCEGRAQGISVRLKARGITLFVRPAIVPGFESVKNVTHQGSFHRRHLLLFSRAKIPYCGNQQCRGQVLIPS